MGETKSFKELYQTLHKRLSLILSITFISVLLVGIVTYFFLTPVYQISTQLLVNKSNSEQTQYNVGDVQTNLQLINTYNVIIKSPAILEIVIKDLKLDLTVSELNEKMTVQTEKDSQVITLSVQDSNAEMAAKIANKTAEIFKQEIVKIMNVDNVSILAKATVSDEISPIKPQPVLNIAIAIIVGLIAGVGTVFILEYIDNTVKDEQEIERLIGVPVLGVIATMDGSQIKDSKKRRAADAKARFRGETIGS